MDSKFIGQNILKYRKVKGWSQDAVAKRADIPFTTLTKIENGTTKNPSIDTLISIAKALNIKVDDLLKK